MLEIQVSSANALCMKLNYVCFSWNADEMTFQLFKFSLLRNMKSSGRNVADMRVILLLLLHAFCAVCLKYGKFSFDDMFEITYQLFKFSLLQDMKSLG